MKNVFLIIPIIGIFMISSCNKDEVEDNYNASLETASSHIEITPEDPEDPGKNLVLGIAPGLYGPKKAKALQTVTYGYVAHANALAEIPPAKRRYRIYFQVKNPALPDVNWDPQASFEIPSANTKVKFPKFGSNTFATWRVIYTMYHKDKPHWGYSYRKKVRVKN